MTDPALEDYIESEIIPRYAHFDKAHDIAHVRSVIERSLALARARGADERTAYVVAAYHDTGLIAGRERHHLVSGEILAADPVLRRFFPPAAIALMREAVEDHRASAARPPRNLYGRIVAAADRLIDPDTVFRRTVQYGLAHYPALDREAHFRRFRDHLLEKYAAGGYLRLPPDDTDNLRRLDALRRLLGDPGTLRTAFDRLYDAERETR